MSPIDSGALRCGQLSRTHTAWLGLGLGLGVGVGVALTLPLVLMPYLFPRITVEDDGLAP